MKIEDTFVVDAPASEVYAALLDLERVAPCVPGADSVEKVDDANYKARIRIKVGPITMQYRADIEIVAQDPDAKTATMKVRAKETRGQGSAEATTDLSLTETGGRTEGVIGVDVNLTGRVASMGQGAIKDVSSRLVSAFAANLGTMLSAGTSTAAEEPPAAASAAEAQPAPPPRAAAPPPPAAEPLSVNAIAGDIVKERLGGAPLLGIVGLLAFVAGFLVGSRRG